MFPLFISSLQRYSSGFSPERTKSIVTKHFPPRFGRLFEAILPQSRSVTRLHKPSKMNPGAARTLRLAARQRLTTRVTLPATSTRLLAARAMHTSKSQNEQRKPRNPEPRQHPAYEPKPRIDENIGRKRFGDFDVAGKVFVVTGGAQGLGLTLAEALVEAGGKGKPLFPRSPAPHIPLFLFPVLQL